jgi:hypothetical protein
MKILYSLFVCLLLIATMPKAAAQIYRFKATSYSVMEKSSNGKWGKWAPFKQSTVVITLDGKKDRLIISSADLQLFNIIAYGEKISTEYDDTITLDCRDNDGANCNIAIITRKNQDNRKQIYINYPDVKFVYNIYVTN